MTVDWTASDVAQTIVRWVQLLAAMLIGSLVGIVGGAFWLWYMFPVVLIVAGVVVLIAKVRE